MVGERKPQWLDTCVSLAQLKTHLSHYLSHMAVSCRFIVTDRGQPVAMLEPLGTDERFRATVMELGRTGQVRSSELRRDLEFTLLKRRAS